MTKTFSIAGIAVAALLVASAFFVFADSALSVDFESPTYSLGTINGQDGWSSTGAAGSGCAVYDHVLSSSFGVPGFGAQSLRISNAVTSGCFGDQTFSKSLTQEAGETDAQNGGMSGGTRQNHFEAEFEIRAMQLSQQSGLFLSVSPDRGDGARMSYLGFRDDSDGIRVNFYDVQGTSSSANFVETVVATGLSRAVTHTAKFEIDFVDGHSNDVVKIYIDGALVHTGTTWENYFRFDPESNPSLVNESRTVDSLLFRTGGTAAPATAGLGYLIDNVELSSSGGPVPTSETIVVAPSNMQGWGFAPENTTGGQSGQMVFGPVGQPLGDGSAQLVLTASNEGQILAVAAFAGTSLDEIQVLTYQTYRTAGDPALAPALSFNFDGDVTDANDAFQGRLTYEPYHTQTVSTGVWQEWNALNDAAGTGTGNWWFSNATHAANSGCTMATPCTWAEVLAAFPNGGVHNTLGAVVFKAGSGWTSFDGNVDKFVIGIQDGILALHTITYDFEPDPILPDVTVTIVKYVDGVHATAGNANSLSFPMSASWSAVNIGAGSGSFALSTSGFNNPNPYEATTANMTSGADYSTNEDLTQSNVGASCSEGKPFALVGYTTGDTEAAAALGTPSTTTPSLTGIATSTYIIVWNEKCTTTLTLQKVVVNDDSGTELDTAWTLSATGTTPISGVEGTASVTNAAVTAGTYDLSESGPVGYTPSVWVCTGGTQNDADTVTIANGEHVTCTITNDDVAAPAGPLPPANACSNTSAAPTGYTLVLGTNGNDTQSIVPFTMFVGLNGNDTVSGLAPGNYIICTGGGNDIITIGNGHFTIAAGNGNNTITTGNGDGFISTLNGNDKVTTGNGVQTITAANGINTIQTGDGNKTITTTSANDVIKTGAGNDVINAGGGMNVIKSGAGNDTITTGTAADNIDGGADIDTCNAGSGAPNTLVNCEA